jgi:phage gp29-like protein
MYGHDIEMIAEAALQLISTDISESKDGDKIVVPQKASNETIH